MKKVDYTGHWLYNNTWFSVSYIPQAIVLSEGRDNSVRGSYLRKREHYEKPSVKRKKKAEAARKRKW